MPVPFRIRIGKLLHEGPFALQVFDHFLYRNIIIGNGRGFPIPLNTHMLEFHDQCRLMGLGPF